MTTENTVTLESPIKRGDTEITSIELRKPDSGALRGCSLQALLESKADDIMKLLPRITTPPITDHEVARLDAADLLQAGVVIVSFLLPRRAMAEAAAAANYPLQ